MENMDYSLEKLELETFKEKDLKMPEGELERTTWIRRNKKAKKIIIDTISDHNLPSTSLKTAYEVFKTIKNIFEINNASIILTLKQKLVNIKIYIGEAIRTYFLRISEIKDQLATIGNNIDDLELSLIALRGLPISLESFIQCVSRPSLPKFDQLKNK